MVYALHMPCSASYELCSSDLHGELQKHKNKYNNYYETCLYIVINLIIIISKFRLWIPLLFLCFVIILIRMIVIPNMRTVITAPAAAPTPSPTAIVKFKLH